MAHDAQQPRQVLGVDVTAQTVMLILTVLAVGALVAWAVLGWLEKLG
jgi:hypothetical protein